MEWAAMERATLALSSAALCWTARGAPVQQNLPQWLVSAALQPVSWSTVALCGSELLRICCWPRQHFFRCCKHQLETMTLCRWLNNPLLTPRCLYAPPTVYSAWHFFHVRRSGAVISHQVCLATSKRPGRGQYCCAHCLLRIYDKGGNTDSFYDARIFSLLMVGTALSPISSGLFCRSLLGGRPAAHLWQQTSPSLCLNTGVEILDFYPVITLRRMLGKAHVRGFWEDASAMYSFFLFHKLPTN